MSYGGETDGRIVVAVVVIVVLMVVLGA